MVAFRPPNSGGYPGSSQPLSNSSRCQCRAQSGYVTGGPRALERLASVGQMLVEERGELGTERLDISIERQLHGAPAGSKFW